MKPINPTDCPYYLISRSTLLVTAELKRGFASAGVEQVKPAYLGALMCLWREDGLKMIELGQRAGLEPSTMTGLLDRMERDNLVCRSSDPADRRVIKIFLTEEGKNIREPVFRILEGTLNKVFMGISPEAIDQMKNTLTRILENSSR
jgi:DNA-binding MarR family transcriptional regulator